jgi:hypothetical protein
MTQRRTDPPPPVGERPQDTPGFYAEAACRGADPALFFPTRSDDDFADHCLEAFAICESCPSAAPCREKGLSESYGVWGGLLRG